MTMVNLDLTSLFLTGSTTSGLTIPSKAPRSPVTRLIMLTILVRLVVYPGPCQLQLAAAQEGGQRQPGGPEKKVSTIILHQFGWRFHLLGRAGRPVERNCEIKVH